MRCIHSPCTLRAGNPARNWIVIVAIACCWSTLTGAGCNEEPTPNADADVQDASSQAIAPTLSIRGPSYVRVDWVGRFEIDICRAEDPVVLLSWGDGYIDKLDLAIISLPASAPGCRVFRTTHIYGAVGATQVSVTATWPDGVQRATKHLVEVLAVPAHEPQNSAPIALAAPYAVVVSTDANQLVVYERSTSQEFEHSLGGMLESPMSSATIVGRIRPISL